MKTIRLWCAVAVLFMSCAPPPGPNAVINNAIVSSGVDGKADDANDNTNPPTDNYVGPNKLAAKDAGTDASSIAPLFNKVGGTAHAIPGAPATKDQAVAISNNKVVTTLSVQKADGFTFDIALELKGPKITGQGKLLIQLSAFVLDAQGRTVKDAQGNDLPAIFSGTYTGGTDAQGKFGFIPPGDTNVDPVDANGNYVRKLSGPNRGLPLPVGNYQVKLELNIQALAPAGQGTAGVDSATATITLR